MIWKFLISFLAFFRGSHVGDENAPFVGRQPWEPQTPAEEKIAFEALHNTHEGGDMILPPGQLLGNSMADVRYRWPGYPGAGKIPYVIDPSVNSKYHDIINRAIEQYNKLTCVKFSPRKSEKDYVRILKDKKEKGCWSYVGKVGGSQKLSLGDGCYYIGTIVHELGHALGFLHEHQRSDRDKYVTINTKNILTGFERDFKKTKASNELIFNDFDYISIMIYGNYAFSKQPFKLKTMEAKNGKELTEPFNKPGLDNSDIDRVKAMYKCKK